MSFLNICSSQLYQQVYFFLLLNRLILHLEIQRVQIYLQLNFCKISPFSFTNKSNQLHKKIISFIRWYLYLHHTEILFAYLYYQWVSCKEEKIRNKCNWHIPPDLYIFHEMGFSGYWGQLVSLFLPANLLLLYCVLVIRRERIL